MGRMHAGDLTPRHVPIACPSCRRTLQACPEHLGRMFRCGHCEHAFRARSEDDEIPNDPAPERADGTTIFLEIPCPNCRHGLRVRARHLGRRARCKYCEHEFIATVESRRDFNRLADDRRPPKASPTVETETPGREATHAHREETPYSRGPMGDNTSGPAASRPARRGRRASKRFLIAKVAAACLLGGGAIRYLDGRSLADYGRWLPRFPLTITSPSPGGRGMISGPPAHSAAATGWIQRPDDRRRIVCSGRVEPISGEVDVASQVEGQLAEVRVTEGDAVKEGQILAILQGPREVAELSVAEANVAIARSRLAQVEAGNGPEEIQRALHEVEAQEALLAFERQHLGRLYRLLSRRSVSQDDYERQERKVEQLQRQRDGLRKHYEAVRRGPLPEEVEVARGELALAEKRLRRIQVERDLLHIRAPMSGTILEVYRHAGDSVITDLPTPILRMADTSRLRIRLEIDEASITRLRPGLRGTLQIRGPTTDIGRLTITTIIPVFGPKRLFNPDTSARYDTRTLAVFCEPSDLRVPLYPGQRVTASLIDAPLMAATRDLAQEKFAASPRSE